MFLEKVLSRRKFLQGTALAAAGGAAGLAEQRIVSPVWDQYSDWHEATHVSSEEFTQRYADMFSRMKIGCSLSPEHLDAIGVENSNPHEVVGLLKKYFNCNHIRFGMRWSNCVDENHDVDLSYYIPWIESIIRNNIPITICFGPNKTFRFPEFFQPKYIMEQLEYDHDLPEVGSTIDLNSTLGLYSIEYAEAFFDTFKSVFGQNIDLIRAFQPENEYLNRFGSRQYVMAQSYMKKLCQIITTRAPHAGIVLNTSGVSWARKSVLVDFVDSVINLQDEFPYSTFTAGIDQYEETDAFGMIPGLQIYPDTITGIQIAHGRNHIPNQINRLYRRGIHFKAVELQNEGWVEGNREYPPGSAPHLQFMLLRYGKNFLGHCTHEVDIWGQEESIKQYYQNPNAFYTNPNNILIQKINTLH